MRQLTIARTITIRQNQAPIDIGSPIASKSRITNVVNVRLLPKPRTTYVSYSAIFWAFPVHCCIMETTKSFVSSAFGVVFVGKASWYIVSCLAAILSFFPTTNSNASEVDSNGVSASVEGNFTYYDTALQADLTNTTLRLTNSNSNRSIGSCTIRYSQLRNNGTTLYSGRSTESNIIIPPSSTRYVTVAYLLNDSNYGPTWSILKLDSLSCPFAWSSYTNGTSLTYSLGSESVSGQFTNTVITIRNPTRVVQHTSANIYMKAPSGSIVDTSTISGSDSNCSLLDVPANSTITCKIGRLTDTPFRSFGFMWTSWKLSGDTPAPGPGTSSGSGVRVGSVTSARSLATRAHVAVSSKSKVTISIASKYRRICKVQNNSVKALSTGVCSVVITVQSKLATKTKVYKLTVK